MKKSCESSPFVSFSFSVSVPNLSFPFQVCTRSGLQQLSLRPFHSVKSRSTAAVPVQTAFPPSSLKTSSARHLCFRDLLLLLAINLLAAASILASSITNSTLESLPPLLFRPTSNNSSSFATNSLPIQLNIMGSNLFTGFTRLCKGLAVILVGGYATLQIFPSAVTFLALIPARTIPFAWNLVTAGYIEQSLPGVAISTLGLLFIGKLLEPLWGSREFFKFIMVVNFLTSICVFVTAIALYYMTRQESYLYTPLSGFHGVLSGFLVGIKQILPDQELSLLKIKAKWMPTILVLVSVVVSFFTAEAVSYLPTLLFGIYMSWIYLRYFQRQPETNFRGDPSDEFSFSSFFPEFLRPILDPIASIFDRVFCGRSEASGEISGHILGGSPLPGSDPIEASRRRERGARALEQRLAAEKLSASGIPESAPHEDAADNV